MFADVGMTTKNSFYGFHIKVLQTDLGLIKAKITQILYLSRSQDDKNFDRVNLL